MSRLVVFICALLCAGAAAAQDRVYRCGADGRSYSQEPCDTGRAVDVADPRSAAQAAQTYQSAQRDARLADTLQREREQAERAALRRGAAGIGSSAAGGAAACRKTAGCGRDEPSARRHEKPRQVTLYRAAADSR